MTYCMVRYGPEGRDITGAVIPGWRVLTSVLFDDKESGLAFMDTISGRTELFEMVPIAVRDGDAVEPST